MDDGAWTEQENTARGADARGWGTKVETFKAETRTIWWFSLGEGARWKTQCIAREGVPRHQIWTRSTMSEGVRAAGMCSVGPFLGLRSPISALAAYADEYIDEELYPDSVSDDGYDYDAIWSSLNSMPSPGIHSYRADNHL